jgi:hypothetical protein
MVNRKFEINHLSCVSKPNSYVNSNRCIASISRDYYQSCNYGRWSPLVEARNNPEKWSKDCFLTEAVFLLNSPIHPLGIMEIIINILAMAGIINTQDTGADRSKP